MRGLLPMSLGRMQWPDGINTIKERGLPRGVKHGLNRYGEDQLADHTKDQGIRHLGKNKKNKKLLYGLCLQNAYCTTTPRSLLKASKTLPVPRAALHQGHNPPYRSLPPGSPQHHQY